MNREELKALGLEDEQIESVMSSYGKSVNDIKAKADKVDVLESQVTDYEDQITKRDEQLEKLGEIDVDSFKSEIDRLKTENETIATESETRLNQELAKRDKDNAIDLKLRDSGVIYPDLVKKVMTLDDVTFSEGNLIGFDDVLSATKESYEGLFPSGDDVEGDGTGSFVPGATQKTNPRRDVNKAEAGKLKAQERHAKKENKEE